VRFQPVVRAIEPVSLAAARWIPNGPRIALAEFIGSQLILARKDFDPFREASTTFTGTRSAGQVVNVNSAVSASSGWSAKITGDRRGANLSNADSTPSWRSSHWSFRRSSKRFRSQHLSRPTWTLGPGLMA